LLDYSTFFGGGYGNNAGAVGYYEYERAYSIDVGQDGCIHICGETSSDFPVTAGAYDTTYGGYHDIFVTKIDTDGVSLIWSTLIGGSGEDHAYSIKVDSAGVVYITGYTASDDFPTTPGAYQYEPPIVSTNAKNVFVTKISATGTSLIWSTFLGGGGAEYAYSIDVDIFQNVYVTGYTYSTDFPVNPEAYDTTKGEGYDIFVAKISNDGSSLVWATYLGGEGYGGAQEDERAYSIKLDDLQNVYITGYTQSSDFPTTPGAYASSPPAIYVNDVFITKINSSGSSLVWSTFLGGSAVAEDVGFSLAVDDYGDVYVTGYTKSSNFPTTPDAFDTTYNEPPLCASFIDERDAFVCKISSEGSSLAWSTYLGGVLRDEGKSITISKSGNIFVTGLTRSSDFPTTADVYDTTYNGDVDVFIVKFKQEDVSPTTVTGDSDSTGTGYEDVSSEEQGDSQDGGGGGCGGQIVMQNFVWAQNIIVIILIGVCVFFAYIKKYLTTRSG
jgi:hypothetical protein